MPGKGKRWLSLSASVAFWLLIWQGLAMLLREELLLPTPWTVAKTLWRMWGETAFWMAVGASLMRVALGFAAAVVLGVVLGILTARFRLLEVLFSPVLYGMRSIPVASFIILAYLWIQLPVLPGFIAAVMVLPLVWTNVNSGIRETDRRLLEMAQVYRFGRYKTLRYVWLPSVRPYFRAACVTGLGFAWKSGIAAEVICSPEIAIGTALKDAKTYLETPEVFAWTVTVVLLSVVLERVLLRAFREKKGGAA